MQHFTVTCTVILQQQQKTPIKIFKAFFGSSIYLPGTGTALSKIKFRQKIRSAVLWILNYFFGSGPYSIFLWVFDQNHTGTF
jgi:hypothetical protein